MSNERDPQDTSDNEPEQDDARQGNPGAGERDIVRDAPSAALEPDREDDPVKSGGQDTSTADNDDIRTGIGDGDDGRNFGVRDLGAPSRDVPEPKRGKPFDPDPHRERIRGRLAIASFVVFAVFALGVALTVAAGWSTWDELEGMTGTLLPAIVSLVGTTTGFYFGTKAKEAS